MTISELARNQQQQRIATLAQRQQGKPHVNLDGYRQGVEMQA